MQRRWLWIMPLVLLLVRPVSASGQSDYEHRRISKTDRAVEDAVTTGAARTRVIVRVKPGLRHAWAESLRSSGVRVRAEHDVVDSVSLDLSASEIDAVARAPWIESVSSDADVRAHGDGESSSKSRSLNGAVMATLGVPQMPYGSAPVGVAVIDSGIQASADIPRSRIIRFVDFTGNPAGVETDPYDDYGHGTHVAGLIGGSGDVSDGAYPGVAPNVNFVGLKVLDDSGTGSTSAVIAAIQYAIDHHDELDIRIINLSLGHPILEPAATDPLVQAVEAAVRAGIVVVVSAGNYGKNGANGTPGYAGIVSPANAPSALTVGATDTADTVSRLDDDVASFSSRGPTWYDGYAKPDVVAPGNRLVAAAAQGSTIVGKNPGLRVGRTLLRLSGTSMAAGIVSGAVALMLEAHDAVVPQATLT
ncbi:MAG: S8 family peptidase, partial [Acidobacteriota bacterium]